MTTYRLDCPCPDCAAIRRLVASACTLCGEPLGEEVKIYFVDAAAGVAQHASCVWATEAYQP